MNQSECSVSNFVLGVKAIVVQWWNKVDRGWSTRDFDAVAPTVFCALIVVYTCVMWSFVGGDLHVPVLARVTFSLVLGTLAAALTIIAFDGLVGAVRNICKTGQEERAVRAEESK